MLALLTLNLRQKILYWWGGGMLPSAQQFFLHNQRGEPVLRPMWVHYSEAEGVNEISDQFMVGFNLIVKPVLEKGATSYKI